MRLEDPDGHPWTANTSIGWIIFIIAFSCGTAILALAIYLALWIRSKGRSLLPLIGFSLTTIMLSNMFVLYHVHFSNTLIDRLYLIQYVLWLASTYSLRYEIRAFYRNSEGWDIGIGPILTYFFTVVYINYCLNPFTITSNNEKSNPITSLNIEPSDPLAK